MISVTEAQSRIASLLRPVETETVDLRDAGGRVLAETVVAARSQPPFASSAMDGYAVRSADVSDGAVLRQIGESAAGSRFDGTVGAGECVRIFTGAPVPAGADQVVIQEDVSLDGTRVTLAPNRDTSTYIRPAGGDFSAGDTMPAPRRLAPSDVALLASMNVPRVSVYRKPVVALIPTGDELVMPGAQPGPDQIVSSNNFGLKALLEAHGAACRLLPIARDNTASLNAVLDLCAGVDLILTLAGASVGEHDIVQDVLQERGLDLAFHGIAMRPGKPLMAGHLDGTPMIGLPGNPVSSMVCGLVFVVPALGPLTGLPMQAPLRENATLAGPLGANRAREHYMRAFVEATPGGWKIQAFDGQDSSLLKVLSQANALLVRAAGDPALAVGDTVPFIRF